MIATAPFGSTGHESTRTIFGAAALGSVSQQEADRALETLLEHGVNHIDTAASYGDSELRLAPWLAQHRDRFFLATKTGERERAGAREEIQRSLDRLGVDSVDLLQLHNLVDVIEWETALARGRRARGRGRSARRGARPLHRRHGPRPDRPRACICAASTAFRSTRVLLPYSAIQMRDERYAADFEALAAVCAERGVAMQTIKAISLAPWDGRAQTASTWYEPLREQARHRPRSALGARETGRVPEHGRRPRAAAARARRGKPVRGTSAGRGDRRPPRTAKPRRALLSRRLRG